MEKEIQDEMLDLVEEPPVEEVGETEPDRDEGDTSSEVAETESPDYAKMAEQDLLELRRLSPRFAELGSLAELPSASRFGELRELGLSVSEALGALGLLDAPHDTRSHLRASVPRRLGDVGTRMTPSELASAKRLFPRLSEREITRLYRRVSQ